MRPQGGSRCQAPATRRSPLQRSLLYSPPDHRCIFFNTFSPHPLQRGPLRAHASVCYRAYSGTPSSYPLARDRGLVHDFRAVIRDQGLAAAEAKLQNLISTSGVPETDVFAVFLQEYARRQFAPQMHALFRAMRSSGVPLNRHGYNHFLSLYASTGDVKKMEETLQEMTAQGHARSALTYKALFVGYVHARLLGKALRTFADMKSAGYKPNVRTSVHLLRRQMHNELLAAYVRADKINDAEQLLLNMQRVGPVPDTVSYNTVLQGFGSRRLHAPLIALWSEMEAAKVPADAQTFTILLESLAVPQHWTHATKLLTEVSKRNIQLDTTLINVLIDAYGRGGHMEAMWRLYRGMRTSDLEPTAITFTSMASAHARAKDLAGLRRVCELAEAAEVPLNTPFYTAILRGFSKIGRKEDFSKALAKMHNSDVAWDPSLCAVLASHYGRQKDASALRELEEGIISRQVAETPRLLAALTCAYARAGDFVAALRSYDSAMQLPSVDEGLHPPLLIHLARAGRLEEMERVFNDVPTSRYTRLEAVVMAMMNAFKAAGKNEKMTELQQRLQQVLAPQSAQKQTKPPPRH